MGLINKWIKKLENTSFHKRRESAPAYMTGNFDANITRDDAYIKALNTFNDWRNRQRIERLSLQPDEISPLEHVIRTETTESDEAGDEHEVTSSGGDDDIIIIENHIQLGGNMNYKNKYESTSPSTCDTPTSDEQLPMKLSPPKPLRKRLIKIKRSTPSYQSVVNKHGDVVEYALPYIEQNAAAAKELTTDEMNTDCPSPSSFIEPMSLYMENHQMDNLMITDLDRSNESARGHTQNRDILRELDSLEKWSETINGVNVVKENHTFNKNQVSPAGLIICHQNDICRTGIVQSNILTSIEFSTGIFRNTNVWFRTNSKSNKTSTIARIAIEKDFEVLNRIRHSDIVLLMAACYEDNYVEYQKMTMVLESFDYTLNFLLYQMDQKFNLSETIKIVNQISSAIVYLHESGYIHSNISSMSILIRQQPTYCAKLSCFELATEADTIDATKAEINEMYKEDNYTMPNEDKQLSEYVLLLRNTQKNLKEKYRSLSHERSRAGDYLEDYDGYDFSTIQKRHLAYHTVYRRKFSLHNYQAPEILKSQEQFVFPTKLCDIYSLSLLAWEILNNSIPYIIYNAVELEKLFGTRKVMQQNALLPPLEHHRCVYFDKILKYGLHVLPCKRMINVKHFVLLLDNIKNDLVTVGLYHENNDYLKKRSPDKMRNGKIPEYGNIENTNPNPVEKIYDKTRPDFLNESNGTGDTKQDNSEVQNMYTESIPSPRKQRTHGEISSMFPSFFRELDKLSVSRMTTPEKPIPPPKPSTVGTPPGHLPNVSEMSSFDQFLSSKAIYERTSTLKKKKKRPAIPAIANNAAVKNLFSENNAAPIIETVEEKSYEKVNQELNDIPDSIKYTKNDFFKEINDFNNTPVPLKERDPNILETPKNSSSAILNNIKNNISNSCPAPSATATAAHNNSSYRFNIGDFAIPDTPIARKNKIRRNAWLSDHKFAAQREQQYDKRNDSNALKVLNNTAATNQSPDGPNYKKCNTFSNLSTDISKCLTEKFHELLPDFTDKIIEELETPRSPESAVVVDIEPEFTPKIKMEDSNADYHTPAPSELLPPPRLILSAVVNEAIKRQETRQHHEVFQKLENPEEKLNAAEVSQAESEPRRISVQEAVQRIESMAKLENGNNALVRRNTITPKHHSIYTTPPTYSTPNHVGSIIKRTVLQESAYSDLQKTVDTSDATTPQSSNPGGGALRKNKKLTTRVTVNFRKTARRTSDLGMELCKTSSCPTSTLTRSARHTITGELRLADPMRHRQNAKVDELRKLFCGNCRHNITADQVMGLLENPITFQAIGDGNSFRLSEISNNIIRNNDGKSTEDLYIDDDFCQGLCLGANMELIPDPDNLVGSINFDIFSDNEDNISNKGDNKFIKYY